MVNEFLRVGEFSKNATNHFWFDLNFDESVTSVNSNNVINEFGENDHVTKVSTNNWWFDTGLVSNRFTSLSEFSDKVDVLNTK